MTDHVMFLVLVNTVVDYQVTKGLPAATKAVHSKAYQPYLTGLLSMYVCGKPGKAWTPWDNKHTAERAP